MADENQETFLKPTRRSYVYENSNNSGGKNKVILIIVGIIILVILVIVAIFASGKGSRLTQKIANKPTLTSPSESPTETPTPTSEALKRSDLSIEIQNGSGKAGTASKASDFLKGLGYKIATTGNADNFNYDKTVVEVKPDKKAYLDQLKQDLSKDYTVGSASADLSKGSADAVVIIGQE